MTTSIREQITASVFTLVQGTQGVSGRVYRSRVEAFSRGSTPALVVEAVRNISEAQKAGIETLPQRLELRFLLMIDAPIPEQSADPILVDLHGRLMADMTLGGLSSGILPGDTEWDFAENGIAVVTVSYVVQYRTKTKSISTGA